MLSSRILLPVRTFFRSSHSILGARYIASGRLCRNDKPSAADDPFVLPFHPAVDPQKQAASPSPTPNSTSTPAHTQATRSEGSQPDSAAALNEALSSAYQTEGLTTWAPIRVPGRTREDESRPKRIARLIYQTRKRGILETDLILSTWAKSNLHSLTDDELDEFDRLLDEPDWDIFYWCTERKAPPERWHDSFSTEGRVGHRLVVHTRNEDRVIRRMPEVPPSVDPQV